MSTLESINEHIRGLVVTIKTGIKAGKNVALTDGQMKNRYKDLANQYHAIHGGDKMNITEIKAALANGRISIDNL